MVYNERFRLNYIQTNRDSNDTFIDLDINFDNPDSSHAVAHKMQIFLESIGYDDIEVKVK